ncbi:MAG TPA: CoA-binding protein [Longimicrobium sp.]|nr:CoA-binding protein [Longimicrobium sp.]
MENWQENLVSDDARIAQIFRDTKRIAVLGMKTEAQAGQPAFYVPEYLHAAGYDVVPVPVYFPDVTHILGKQVYRRVVDIPGGVDLVNIFRRGQDVPPHVDDILAAKPKAVWMQSGIAHDEAARCLAEAGILVVQNRCAMVEHRRLAR